MIASVSISALRRSTLIAVVSLFLLQIADVVTTKLLLAHHAIEANPLSALLLTNNTLGFVKLALVPLLGIRVIRKPGNFGVSCAVWFATGIYATAVLSNILLLRMT